MEREPKKPEDKNDEDDSDGEVDLSKSKNSKKSEDQKNDENPKPAKFFVSKKLIEADKNTAEDSNSEQEELEDLTPEESGNLTESEVHEVVLSVVDARMQEVSQELEESAADSQEEYVAMSSAIFLEAVASQANSEQDLTPEVVDAVYDETIEDISLDDEYDSNDDGAEPPDAGITTESNDLPDPPEVPTHLISTPSPPQFSPDTEPSVPAPIRSTDVPDTYEAYIPRSDMLLGVVVGYIIGRRGGRIRTEKRLKPEIKKLEQQVAEITDVVLQKEKLIRKQSQDIYEKSFSVTDKANAVIERRKVRAKVNEQLKRREELLNNPGVEKIGKFSLPALKVFHERRLPDGSENSPSRVQVEVMTTDQLLEKVVGLNVDGMSVSEMFHRNRLNVEALRQITKEYLRGGEYKKTYYRELGPDLEKAESLRQKISQKHETRPDDRSYDIDKSKSPSLNSQNESSEVQSSIVSKQNIKTENRVIKLSVTIGIVIALLIIYLFLR